MIKYLHVKKQTAKIKDNNTYHILKEKQHRLVRSTYGGKIDREVENAGNFVQLILNSSSVDTYVWISPSLIRRSIDGNIGGAAITSRIVDS